MNTAYLLVTVKERDIKTAQFPTHEEARERMLSELKREFLKEFDKSDWDEIRVENPEEFQADVCGYGPTAAWSNVDDDLNCDWLIVPVTIK